MARTFDAGCRQKRHERCCSRRGDGCRIGRSPKHGNYSEVVPGDGVRCCLLGSGAIGAMPNFMGKVVTGGSGWDETWTTMRGASREAVQKAMEAGRANVS